MSQNQKGGFLFEALLMIAIIIVIMPFMVHKLLDKQVLKENVAVEHYLTTLSNAAKGFVTDNRESFINGVVIFENDVLKSALEPYGLPNGFMLKTPLNQTVSLIISKNDNDILSLISISDTPKPMSDTRKTELAVRMGYYGALLKDDVLYGATGGWEENIKKYNLVLHKENIYVLVSNIPEMDEILTRKKIGTSTDQQKMHVHLNMNQNDIKDVNFIESKNGNFDTVNVKEKVSVSAEDESNIKNIESSNLFFQTLLKINDITAKLLTIQTQNISGDASLEVSDKLSVLKFVSDNLLSVKKIDIKGNFNAYNSSLNIKQLQTNRILQSDENAVLISPKISTSFVNFYNEKFSNLDKDSDIKYDASINFDKGADLEDIHSPYIHNNLIQIPSEIDVSSDISCKSLINKLGGYSYSDHSVSQNLICLNMMYYRLWIRSKIIYCMGIEEKSYRECKAEVVEEVLK